MPPSWRRWWWTSLPEFGSTHADLRRRLLERRLDGTGARLLGPRASGGRRRRSVGSGRAGGGGLRTRWRGRRSRSGPPRIAATVSNWPPKLPRSPGMTVMRAIGQECRDGDTAGCGAVGRSCHPCCGFDSARAADHGAGSRRRADQEYRRGSWNQPAHFRKPPCLDHEEDRVEVHSGAGEIDTVRYLACRRQALVRSGSPATAAQRITCR